MADKHDDLTRRAAELAECALRTRGTAAELMAETEQLAYRFAEVRKTRARALEQIRERHARGTAADTREGDLPSPDPPPETALVPGEYARNGAVCGGLAGAAGAGMLDPDEVTALAALLEELGARDRRDPLCAQALQAAALLRQRAAAGHRPRGGGPEARREAGDIRDGSAEGRDALAAERDRQADVRDDRSVERDRLADDADGQSSAAEQRVRDLLRDAEMRDKEAAEHAAAQLAASGGTDGQRWQPDQELAETGRARNAEDREAIQEMLLRARADRHAARRGRWADGQDRVAGRRDRGAAQADRQSATSDRYAARGDRDQTVIEGEEEDPPGTVTSGA